MNSDTMTALKLVRKKWHCAFCPESYGNQTDAIIHMTEVHGDKL